MSPAGAGTGLGELYRSLAVLSEPPAPEHARIATVLGLPEPPDPETATRLLSLDYIPFASVYVGAEGQVGGEAADRIAGFWRALGESPPANVDELPVVLGLQANLWDQTRGRTGGPGVQARNAFLWEHVASWVTPFATRIVEVGGDFYSAWAAVLGSTVATDAWIAGPPLSVPLHFREAPALGLDSESTATAIADALLVPVRSGIILGRPDVDRMMAAVGVTTRVGSRRYALHDAIQTARNPALHWLAGEALRQEAVWRRLNEPLLPVTSFWSERAQTTAAFLRGIAGPSD